MPAAGGTCVQFIERTLANAMAATYLIGAQVLATLVITMVVLPFMVSITKQLERPSRGDPRTHPPTPPCLVPPHDPPPGPLSRTGLEFIA